jgi:Protein of unknown function (DUF1579)
MKRVLTLSALFVFLASSAPAQFELPEPGPEHKKLKTYEGVWDAVVNSQGQESKGVMTYKMGLRGLWLFETFEGDFGDMKFEGKGATTYDPAKKKFINIWIDSMSTAPMISEGNVDESGKMVMKGHMPAGGKNIPVTMIGEDKGKDMKVFRMIVSENGKEMEMMKITYKRRTK